MPRRAPEGWDGSARRGAAGMPLVFGGLGIALPKTPFKPFGAQDTSGMGWPFLWFLSFGQAKERNLAVGPKPDIKISRGKFNNIRTITLPLIVPTRAKKSSEFIWVFQANSY